MNGSRSSIRKTRPWIRRNKPSIPVFLHQTGDQFLWNPTWMYSHRVLYLSCIAYHRVSLLGKNIKKGLAYLSMHGIQQTSVHWGLFQSASTMTTTSNSGFDGPMSWAALKRVRLHHVIGYKADPLLIVSDSDDRLSLGRSHVLSNIYDLLLRNFL